MPEMVYNTSLGFNHHIIVALRSVYQCGAVKYDRLEQMVKYLDQY